MKLLIYAAFGVMWLISCTPKENCTNSIDDDGNGKMDCFDEACYAHPVCVALRCQDGVFEPEYEQCDPSTPMTSSCFDVGFYEGTPSCTYECKLSAVGCMGTCGDGILQNEFEVCDGTQLNGATCEQFGFNPGSIQCTDGCLYDFSSCGGMCGDGIKNGPEECDGTDFGGDTCAEMGFLGGTLRCNDDCTVDTEPCLYCGDGVVDTELGEECDGANLDNQTCSSLGMHTGALSCTEECKFYTAQCLRCGDGVYSPTYGEECDGDVSNGYSCLTFGMSGGQLTCSSSCEFDLDGCLFCGDGIISPEVGEQCEGANLGGETCESLGYGPGTISCNADCTYQIDCFTNCGDGVVNTEYGEECDTLPPAGMKCSDAGLPFGEVGCSSECYVTYDMCRNYFIHSFEGSIFDGDVDGDGNYIVVGIDRPSGASDPVGYVAKWSPDGELLWERSIEGASSLFRSVAISSQGEIYTVGVGDNDFMGSSVAGGFDVSLTKFDSDGNLLWHHMFGGPGNEFLARVAVTPNGVVAVSGIADVGYDPAFPNDHSLFIRKYDPTGALLTEMTTPLTGWGYVMDVVSDSQGNLYITGSYNGSLLSLPNAISTMFFLMKFDSSGQYVWGDAERSGTSGQGQSIHVSGSGEVTLATKGLVLADGSGPFGAPSAVIVRKYDASGARLWSTIVSSEDNDEPQGVTVTDTGEIVVVGYTEGNLFPGAFGGNRDYFIIKLNSAGVVTSIQQEGGSGFEFLNVVKFVPPNIVYFGYGDLFHLQPVPLSNYWVYLE